MAHPWLQTTLQRHRPSKSLQRAGVRLEPAGRLWEAQGHLGSKGYGKAENAGPVQGERKCGGHGAWSYGAVRARKQHKPLGKVRDC